MKTLRRKNRELPVEETADLLNRAEYGVLSTVSADGWPYGVPLNYCVIENFLYFHCANEGHKIDNILQNRHVSFCAVENTKVLPEKFGTLYESVIVFGNAEEVFDDIKQMGLEGLIGKYSSDYMAKGLKYIKSDFSKTRVFRIHIDTITGKARKK